MQMGLAQQRNSPSRSNGLLIDGLRDQREPHASRVRQAVGDRRVAQDPDHDRLEVHELLPELAVAAQLAEIFVD